MPPSIFLLLLLSCWHPLSAHPASHQEPSIRPELVEAALSESLRLHLVQSCQGDRLNLQCPRHTHISPLNSFFGRLVPSRELCPSEGAGLDEEDTSCDFAEANARVQELCRSKRKCRLWVRPELFGERDPCPGTAKYLQIGYKCSPVSFEDQNFCEGQQTRLGCKPGQRLSIYSAHYGRTANGQAMHCDNGDGGRGRQVNQADCVADVLPQIARRCHAQPWCSFPVDDRFLGSPCPGGISKYLSVIFVCVNEEVFSEAALRGRLETMEELGRELDSFRWRNGSAQQERMTNAATKPQAWHPLLGDNWTEEEEEEEGEEGEGSGRMEEAARREEVDEKPAEEEEAREERRGETATKRIHSPAGEWPWGGALLGDSEQEALPWLLLSLLLSTILFFLSICLFWQCRARAKERRERKMAEERAVANPSRKKKMGREGAHHPHPPPPHHPPAAAYLLESEGSSQRLLDSLGQLHSSAADIYHGCYLPPPSGASSGTASVYGGNGGGGGGYYDAHFGDGTILAMGRMGGKMAPPNLHCYS